MKSISFESLKSLKVPEMGKRHGAIAFMKLGMSALAIVGLGAVAWAVAAYAYGTNQPVKRTCQNYLGQWVDCSNIPLSAGGELVGATPTAVAGTKMLPVANLTVSAQLPISNSWSSYAGKFDVYDPSDNLRSSTVSPFKSVAFAAGVAGVTGLKTNTPYKVVLNGNGTYYDTVVEDFFIGDSMFNPADGLASWSIKNTDTRAVGAMIGTTALTLSNASTYTGITFNDTSKVITINTTTASTSFTFDLTYTVSGTDTQVKNLVTEFADGAQATYALEGDEFSSFSASHQSGDAILPTGSMINAVNTLSTVGPKVSVIDTGQSETVRYTPTFVASKCTSGETLDLVLDDLGGYNNQDAVSGNKGATARRVSITFVS